MPQINKSNAPILISPDKLTGKEAVSNPNTSGASHINLSKKAQTLVRLMEKYDDFLQGNLKGFPPMELRQAEEQFPQHVKEMSMTERSLLLKELTPHFKPTAFDGKNTFQSTLEASLNWPENQLDITPSQTGNALSELSLFDLSDHSAKVSSEDVKVALNKDIQREVSMTTGGLYPKSQQLMTLRMEINGMKPSAKDNLLEAVKPLLLHHISEGGSAGKVALQYLNALSEVVSPDSENSKKDDAVSVSLERVQNSFKEDIETQILQDTGKFHPRSNNIMWLSMQIEALKPIDRHALLEKMKPELDASISLGGSAGVVAQRYLEALSK